MFDFFFKLFRRKKPPNDDRVFHKHVDGLTEFSRKHNGGHMTALRRNGKRSRWNFEVSYKGKVLSHSSFRKVRHGEDWARGWIRKARRKERNREMNKPKDVRERIRELLDTNKASLHHALLHLIRVNETPKDSILRHVAELGNDVTALKRLLMLLCPHGAKRVQKGDSGVCSECGAGDGSWWCPKSPDNHCYYFSEEAESKRVVLLKNGETFILPADHKHENETDDTCLFCGAPDERK